MPDALLHAVAGGQSLLGSDWPVLCKYLEEAEGSMVLPVAMGDGSSLSPSPNTHTHTHGYKDMHTIISGRWDL